MSDEARRTPEWEPAAPAGPGTLDTPSRSPLEGGIMVAGRVPSGGSWGELGDAVFSIWSRPRETIRRIVAVNPRYGVVLLAALSGSSTTLMRWPGLDEASLGLMALLVLACTLGPLMGIAFLWIGAWIVRGVGRAMMGGQATPEEMRAALAWANVPQVAALPVALIMTVLAAPTVSLGPSVALGALAVLLGLASLVLGIWGLVIACNTVAEVQGYPSAWKGLGNLLLPMGIVVLIGIVAAILIPLAARR